MVFVSARVVIASFLLLSSLVGSCHGGYLKMNYYKESCGVAEKLIRKITTQKVQENPSLAAKLLRLHFHDCFVKGCDASILLESPSKQAEKDAFPNLSLGGFEVIDEIKAQIERRCKQVVSCADIVTLAARDAVATLNPHAWWKVPTGRRDGVVSVDTDALANLPSPFANFTTLKSNFKSKGLNVTDLVALSGGHTLGITHCGVLFGRLYFFNGRANNTDPSLDKSYADFLKKRCPLTGNPGTEVDMDPSPEKFDSRFYTIVKAKKGIFPSDAALLDDKLSRVLVNRMENEYTFFDFFGKSMRKMAGIQVLTGTAGQIRMNCSRVN